MSINPVRRLAFTNRLLFLNVRGFSTVSYEESVKQMILSAAELQKVGEVIVEDRSGGCGANFYIRVESTAFRGMPRIQQHRSVQQVLKDEIAKWHAVSIETSVPK
jgi:BolA-like protein 3